MLGHVWLLFFKTVLKKIIFKNSFWYFQEKKNRVWELENIFCSKKKEILLERGRGNKNMESKQKQLWIVVIFKYILF